jgi:hypothetical protein
MTHSSEIGYFLCEISNYSMYFFLLRNLNTDTWHPPAIENTKFQTQYVISREGSGVGTEMSQKNYHCLCYGVFFSEQKPTHSLEKYRSHVRQTILDSLGLRHFWNYFNRMSHLREHSRQMTGVLKNGRFCTTADYGQRPKKRRTTAQKNCTTAEFVRCT